MVCWCDALSIPVVENERAGERVALSALACYGWSRKWLHGKVASDSTLALLRIVRVTF